MGLLRDLAGEQGSLEDCQSSLCVRSDGYSSIVDSASIQHGFSVHLHAFNSPRHERE